MPLFGSRSSRRPKAPDPFNYPAAHRNQRLDNFVPGNGGFLPDRMLNDPRYANDHQVQHVRRIQGMPPPRGQGNHRGHDPRGPPQEDFEDDDMHPRGEAGAADAYRRGARRGYGAPASAHGGSRGRSAQHASHARGTDSHGSQGQYPHDPRDQGVPLHHQRHPDGRMKTTPDGVPYDRLFGDATERELRRIERINGHDGGPIPRYSHPYR